jgi:hypothetical protein
VRLGASSIIKTNNTNRWYNVPYTPSKQSKPQNSETKPEKDDSKPLNFDTFVPTHDPALVHDPGTGTSFVGQEGGAFTATSANAHVQMDEAFEKAMQAMYWSGYWTAVYHVCSWLTLPYFANKRSSLASEK